MSTLFLVSFKKYEFAFLLRENIKYAKMCSGRKPGIYLFTNLRERKMYKILIVEDDEIIADTLKKHLEKWSYEVEIVKDFADVRGEFIKSGAHIVLMDIGLPFFNGYHWCKEIRDISNVPIVFISSMSDNMNIVMAMNMGGDDFITKPFDLNVVTAKLQALLRRTYSFSENTNIYEHRGGILNLDDQTFIFEQQKVELTKNEYRILQVLLENVGKVVSRDRLMQKLWEDEAFIDDNTLTVNVTRLRKKLQEAGMEDYIKTKKGLGYIIE
jgi:DNA-binding response OmpR family regulator